MHFDDYVSEIHVVLDSWSEFPLNKNVLPTPCLNSLL